MSVEQQQLDQIAARKAEILEAATASRKEFETLQDEEAAIRATLIKQAKDMSPQEYAAAKRAITGR